MANPSDDVAVLVGDRDAAGAVVQQLEQLPDRGVGRQGIDASVKAVMSVVSPAARASMTSWAARVPRYCPLPSVTGSAGSRLAANLAAAARAGRSCTETPCGGGTITAVTGVRRRADVGGLVDVDAAAQQLAGVDRVGGDEMADAGGQHDGQHQRQDDRVLAGQLEHDDDSGDRRARRTGEDGAHADQGIGADAAASCGVTACTMSPKNAPAIAPQNRLGAKTPPEPPIPIVRLQASILPISSASRNVIA